MIDTIRLYGDDFKVKNIALWSQHTVMERATGEIHEKETCNTDCINATLYGSRLIVQCSLPRLMYGSNLYELRQRDASDAIDKLQQSLRVDCGLEVAVKSLRFSRVDFCKNIMVDSHITDYIQALSHLRFSRREKAGFKSETLYFRNGQRELVFYDKLKEVRSKKMSDELHEAIKDRPNNILRIESKLKRASVVHKEYADMSIEQMLSEKLSTAKLLKEYDNLNGGDSEQIEFNFKNNVEMVEGIREKRGRAVNKFMEMKGTNQLLRECCYDWSVVQELLMAICDRATAYRWLKKLQDNARALKTFEERNLLKEIRNKIQYREVA